LDLAVVDEAIAEGLAWSRDGDELVKTWSGKDFAAALAYVNSVGELAERAGHHPDIELRWNKVTLRLSTHSVGALTQADLDLAAAIDAVVKPGDGLRPIIFLAV
jgi:4a-hydroxytetrahydrobiopterin dehydratase